MVTRGGRGATAGAASADRVDAKGAVMRRVSSDSARDRAMGRAGGARLPSRAGLNRFVWDMTYPGPWSENANQRGRNGPMAAPGLRRNGGQGVGDGGAVRTEGRKNME